jgi:hypothetical protein
LRYHGSEFTQATAQWPQRQANAFHPISSVSQERAGHEVRLLFLFGSGKIPFCFKLIRATYQHFKKHCGVKISGTFHA